MDQQNNISEILKKNQLIPVVNFQPTDDPIAFVDYLIQKDINCIEVTLRNPFAFKALEMIKNYNATNFDVGVGTVIHQHQIDRLVDLGVDFMVSPALNPKLIEGLKSSHIAFLPGVSTPSEILNAIQLNLNYLKFFPANLFGGIKALKTYASVFGNITFCPTGGINENDYEEYLKLKNVVSVGGSWIQTNYNNTI